MATITLSVNVDTSIAVNAETALCTLAGLPVTAGNAKQVLINFIVNQMAEYNNQQALAAVSAVNSQLFS